MIGRKSKEDICVFSVVTILLGITFYAVYSTFMPHLFVAPRVRVTNTTTLEDLTQIPDEEFDVWHDV